MVKASNGGGGRGMRIVRRVEDLEIEFENARSESKKGIWRRPYIYRKVYRRP